LLADVPLIFGTPLPGLLALGLLTPLAAPNRTTDLSASLFPELASSPFHLGVAFADGGMFVLDSGGPAAGAKVATASGSDALTVSSGLIGSGGGSGCSPYELASGSSTVGSSMVASGSIDACGCGSGSPSFEVPADVTFRAIFSTGFSIGFNATRSVAATESISDATCGSAAAVLSIDANGPGRCGARATSGAGMTSSSGTMIHAPAMALAANASVSGATTATCCAAGAATAPVSAQNGATDASSARSSAASETMVGATPVASGTTIAASTAGSGIAGSWTKISALAVGVASIASRSAELALGSGISGACVTVSDVAASAVSIASSSAEIADAIAVTSTGAVAGRGSEADAGAASDSWWVGLCATLAIIATGAGGGAWSAAMPFAVPGRSTTRAGGAASRGATTGAGRGITAVTFAADCPAH
jgi:hypothetical protein